MQDTGLTEENLAVLMKVFGQFSAVEQAKLYGSRAKGTYNLRSDIDLVVFGRSLNRSDIAMKLMELDDSDLPLLVDLQAYHDLKNPQLIDHINRVGIVVYQR